jgi:hypothetical protein
MSLRNLLLLSCLLPSSAWALSPPLDIPPFPDVPLGPVAPGSPPEAPPLELDLPGPPELPGAAIISMGAPDPLPIPDPPTSIPDLIGDVILPPGAEHVSDLAPPFGGTPGHGQARGGPFSAAVPEPGTATLLALGFGAIAYSRRRSSGGRPMAA